jgi:hypothetical protein
MMFSANMGVEETLSSSKSETKQDSVIRETDERSDQVRKKMSEMDQYKTLFNHDPQS